MLACRNCRVSISASDGCVICNPIRKHLVVVGEQEDERPSLSSTGGEIVAALRGQLKNIRNALNNDPGDEQAEKRLMALANTSAKVIEAARKLQVDGVSAVENMNFSERAELFVQWVMELAPVYRKALKEKWDEMERVESKPLSAVVTKLITSKAGYES